MNQTPIDFGTPAADAPPPAYDSDALTLAHSAYQTALDTKTQLELRLQTTQANGNQTVKDAQKAYDDAVNNLAAA